jgi:transposase
MSMLAEPARLVDEFDVVIGADTHRDSHALAMCNPAGVVLAQIEIPDGPGGFDQALTWIKQHAPGGAEAKVVAGLEGTRSYGIGLARALTQAGHLVIEVEQPRRADRRGRGKSDPIDAILAARHVLNLPADNTAAPRADGPREALRLLLADRRDISGGRTAHINQLRAVLLTGTTAQREMCRISDYTDTVLTRIARTTRTNTARTNTARTNTARTNTTAGTANPEQQVR